MKRERLGNEVMSFVRWNPIRSKSIWARLRYHRPIFNFIFSFSELAEMLSLIKFARCCQKRLAWENDAGLLNALHHQTKSLKNQDFHCVPLEAALSIKGHSSCNLTAVCQGISKSIQNSKWLSNDSRSAAFLSPARTYDDFDFLTCGRMWDLDIYCKDVILWRYVLQLHLL